MSKEVEKCFIGIILHEQTPRREYVYSKHFHNILSEGPSVELALNNETMYLHKYKEKTSS